MAEYTLIKRISHYRVRERLVIPNTFPCIGVEDDEVLEERVHGPFTDENIFRELVETLQSRTKTGYVGDRRYIVSPLVVGTLHCPHCDEQLGNYEDSWTG